MHFVYVLRRGVKSFGTARVAAKDAILFVKVVIIGGKHFNISKGTFTTIIHS